MGSCVFNLFNFNSLCPGLCPCCRENIDDVRTEKIFNKYEDAHIKVECEYSREIVNGRTKNVTESKTIYNKDGYYKPKQLLPS